MPDNIADEAGPTLSDLFGPPIHTYTRADALEDGSLVDASELASEAGIRWPVALTASAWIHTVAWPETAEARKPEGTGQDETGRLWDVLTIARLTLARAARENGSVTDHRLPFTVLRVPAEGREVRPRRATLHLVIGPGDDFEPVVTVMLPEED